MPIREIAEILTGQPVFAGFDAETMALLAGCARNERFAPGSMIFREGDAADKVFILRKGDVAEEIATPAHEPMIVETLHAGDILGWEWLVPPYRSLSDARALTAVSAVSLDAACLRRKCDANPVLGYRMFQHWLPHLTRRVRAQRLQLLDLYGSRAE